MTNKLLEKAIKSLEESKKKVAAPKVINEDHVELALAYIKGEVRATDVVVAMADKVLTPRELQNARGRIDRLCTTVLAKLLSEGRIKDAKK